MGCGEAGDLCSRLLQEHCFELIDIVLSLWESCEFPGDTAAGMKDSRVVATAENVADLSEPLGTTGTHEVHGNVAGVGDVASA